MLTALIILKRAQVGDDVVALVPQLRDARTRAQDVQQSDSLEGVDRTMLTQVREKTCALRTAAGVAVLWC